jgi:D-hexose-6-phosphate mutarotase
MIKKGETCFDFTSLLHTYFRLDSINNAKLHGFKNSNYSDKVFIS